MCGEAGQGIQTVEHILSSVLKLSGYNVFSNKEYMSRVRGGVNSTQIRISDASVRAPVDRIDVLIALSEKAVQHLGKRVSEKTLVVGEEKHTEGQKNKLNVAFTKIAQGTGNRVYANTVAAGFLGGMLSVEQKTLRDYVGNYFSKKSQSIIKENLKAAEEGYEKGAAHKKFFKNLPAKKEKPKKQVLLNGTEAVALGAIAGGVNFVSAYPMSPSTGVLTFLAQHAKEFDIFVEQTEDELSAINMSLGAWYAGARGLVTTSGGGFALMTEGVSLSGMLETPAVVYIAQRPGPATGLPTRTEQGDLNLALYAGHGEFPRIILAPGSLEDAFYLSAKAFELADKHQVPVFILSDQYLADAYYNLDRLETKKTVFKKHFTKTSKDYKRYAFTKNGLSPRGVPGWGEGLVVVDSDEHDEEGHITESMQTRNKMVEKRLKKIEAIEKEAIAPETIGPKNPDTVVVGWGSTHHAVREALENLGKKNASLLYFKQAYPLHPSAAKTLKNAEKTIVVENNATGQFAELLRKETGEKINHRVLKYDGLAFSVEELEKRLGRII